MCAVLPSAECGGGFNPGLLILKARQLCSSSEWMAQGPKGATVCQLPQQQPCARQDGCSHCLCLLQVEDQAEPRLLLFNDVCPVQRHLLRAGRFGAGGGEEMVIFHFSHASLFHPLWCMAGLCQPQRLLTLQASKALASVWLQRDECLQSLPLCGVTACGGASCNHHRHLLQRWGSANPPADESRGCWTLLCVKHGLADVAAKCGGGQVVF